MNKAKVRCAVCGKSFKSPSSKKTVCPACEALAKRAKHVPSVESTVVAAPVTSSSIDIRAALRAAQENQGQFGAYRPPAPPPAAISLEKVPAARQHARTGKAERADHRGSSKELGGKVGAVREPKAPRTPKPRIQTKPFEPTPEQIEAIRGRYVELAQPEYNGIRHQIATELGIPLRAVKLVIKNAREENKIQSWWEHGGGLPSPENLERIRALYIPLLPEPEVGVHKQIASELKITNTSVYQAIGQIRTELHLPRYTPRELAEQSAVEEADDAAPLEALSFSAALGE